MIRGSRAERTLNALFASCIAFVILLVFTFVVSPILGPRIATQFGIKPYGVGWANDIPEGDQIVFPGDTITVNLKQETLEGWYAIENLHLTSNGEPIIPSEIGLKRYGEEIRYHTEYPILKNAGIFIFDVPSTDNLLGENLHILYDLDFKYPKRVSHGYFVWASKPINGSFDLKIGTARQRTLLRLTVAVVWMVITLCVIPCWVGVFAFVSRPLMNVRRLLYFRR